MKKVLSAAMAAVLSMSMAFSSMAATKLPAPVNVQWSPDQEALPQWSRVEGAVEYHVEGYKENDRFYSVYHTFPVTDTKETLSAGGFLNDLEESGIYSFRVKALGDENNTADSDWSSFSEDWSFTKADSILSVPSNLRWNGTVTCWDKAEIPAEYQPYFYGYEVRIYGDGELLVTHNGIRDTSYDEAEWMKEEDIKEYTFAVRTISNTPSKVFHGELVTCTEAYDAENTKTDISDKLDAIITASDSNAIASAPDTLKENIKDLQVAMQSDETVLDQVKALEEAYANQKKIELEVKATDNAEIDTTKISIVGALLNARDNQNVVFNISKPKKLSVVDETAYKNCIQFDFKLLNAVSDLKVPVRITVPIPESINPKYFRVLHDHNGKVEEINPLTVKIDADNRLASFTVTDFSTFIFAEAGAAEEGTDPEQILTPSNAKEFIDLAKKLPDSLDDLEDADKEAVTAALAKLVAALKDSKISASIKNSFLDPETEKALQTISALLDALGDSENLTWDSGIESIKYAFLASGFSGTGEAPTIHFNFNLATPSNAKEKLVFNISMVMDGDETTELISPLKFYLEVPDGYTYNKNDKITVSGGKAKAASEGKVKLSYDEDSDRLVVYTTSLGTFRITGSSSGGSSSVSSGGNSKTSTTPHLPPRSPAGGRWEKDGNNYRYYYSDGMLASNCWLEITWNNTIHWYHFNASGIMDTGWLKDNFGNWYYLNVSPDKVYGSMVTGWNLIDGNWYYFNEKSDGFKGTLLTDVITPDGYQVNSDGVWVH